MTPQPAQALTFAKIVIPLIPVSVNHYWDFKIVRGRIFVQVSKDAKAFMDALAIFSRGQKVVAKEYVLTFRVYLGKGDRGDIANFEKGIGDGLQKAGVIHSDGAIMESHQYKYRDWANPRTEIEVSAKDSLMKI
jgi:Holliday junction resolvase RusA-like endonuclease